MTEADNPSGSDDAGEPVDRHGAGRMSPSQHFAEDLRRDAIAAFGPDGAWLLLSIVWYGWRAYYDLAAAVFQGPGPSDDPRRPSALGDDYQVVLDLHIQGLVFSATEQFATLVTAARAHHRVSDAFFSTYTAPGGSVVELVRGIQDITVDELEGLAGVPARLSDTPTPRSTDDGLLLDPAAMATVEVNGLHIPKSVIDEGARQMAFDDARAHADGLCVSVRQLAELIDRPPGLPDAPAPQPLREVDNAFRHGQRVFFYDAVPDERRFNFLGDPTALEHPAVDLFMPRGRNTNISWATVGCSPERTASSIESLRNVCLCTRLFALGFLGRQTGRGSTLWIAGTTADLPSVSH